MRGTGERRDGRLWGVVLAVVLAVVLIGACASGPHKAVTGKDDKDPTWVGSQSETAAGSALSGGKPSYIDTYNDGTDDPFVKYTEDDRIVFKGASLLGWSYSLDKGKTWTYGGKVKPPDGIDALWGDPAIVTSNTSYRRVYISSLAIGGGKLPP